jgi:hypothetical protein
MAHLPCHLQLEANARVVGYVSDESRGECLDVLVRAGRRHTQAVHDRREVRKNVRGLRKNKTNSGIFNSQAHASLHIGKLTSSKRDLMISCD